MRAMPGMTVHRPGRRDRVRGGRPLGDRRCRAGVPPPRPRRRAGPVRRRLPRSSRAGSSGCAQGSDVLIVSTGHADRPNCVAAAELLDAAGVSAGVLHVPSIKPVDADAIAEAARPVRLVVTRRGALDPRRPGWPGGGDPVASALRAGSCGSGSPTPGASPRPTRSCSSATGCRRSGSPSAWRRSRRPARPAGSSTKAIRPSRSRWIRMSRSRCPTRTTSASPSWASGGSG